jgi:hypothetical protein
MALRYKIARKISARLGAACLLSIVLAYPPSSLKAQTGNCIISGGINNGVQIQNCPIIQTAPTPSFHVVQEYPIKKNDDGTFTRSMLIAIDAPYVPANMLLVASGSTVTDLTIANKSMMVGGKATDPNIHAFWVSEPSGKYTVDVKTSDSETPPSLQLQFNADINVK